MEALEIIFPIANRDAVDHAATLPGNPPHEKAKSWAPWTATGQPDPTPRGDLWTSRWKSPRSTLVHSSSASVPGTPQTGSAWASVTTPDVTALRAIYWRTQVGRRRLVESIVKATSGTNWSCLMASSAITVSCSGDTWLVSLWKGSGYE